MPQHRTPLAKAQLTGALKNHPERYKDRAEPASTAPLGAAGDWLNGGALDAWERFKSELPWLTESDRAIVGSACVLRARIEAGGELNASEHRELRMILGALGATPTSRSNVVVPEEDDKDDPFAKFEQTM